MLGRVIVSIILLFTILLVTLPSSDEKSIVRIASASMLMCTKDFREEVLTALRQNETVTLEFDNKCPALINDLQIDRRGVMTVINHEHQIRMVLQPKRENGGYRWRCKGEPEGKVTGLCKD